MYNKAYIYLRGKIMTDEIRKMIQEKINSEEVRIADIANLGTKEVYNKIWGAIIEKADFLKEEATTTFGIYNLNQFHNEKEWESLRIAKSFNIRHKDEEIYLTMVDKNMYFVLLNKLISMFQSDRVTIKNENNAWTFSIRIDDLVEHASTMNKEEPDTGISR